MTEKELDEFLVDLVKKHGFKTIQRTLKSKKYIHSIKNYFTFFFCLEIKKNINVNNHLHHHHHPVPNLKKKKKRNPNINIRKNILIKKNQNQQNVIGLAHHLHHRKKIVQNITVINKIYFFLYSSIFSIC
jgi:hypothetical protein